MTVRFNEDDSDIKFESVAVKLSDKEVVKLSDGVLEAVAVIGTDDDSDIDFVTISDDETDVFFDMVADTVGDPDTVFDCIMLRVADTL